MLIGIDGSRAFLAQRTGIEEYSYQVIKHLRDKLGDDQACLPVRQVILYIRKNQKIDFDLPKIGSASWRIKIIKFPYFWTQIGLSLEMLFHPVDILFIPAHTIPFIHPKNTIVTIHGLEYEFVTEGYSRWARFYMRRSIRKSCQWASKIVAVSKNTKKDLVNLYKVAEEKIKVIYEGYETDPAQKNCNLDQDAKYGALNTSYLLFVGRIEERKNIIGIIKAFEILKEKFKIPHKLLLAGSPGYGYENIMEYLSSSKFREDIIIAGFVNAEEKCKLFGRADVFLFPTFYEGFGIPVLEAQSMGVPVIVSNTSLMEEVAGRSAVFVNPNEPNEIAEKTNVLIKDKFYRDDIIKKGYENVKRFSWEKCASEISEVLLKK